MGRNKTAGAMFLLTALITALLAMTAVGASAQQYPVDDESADATQDEVPPGGTQVAVCIECFDADSDVVLNVVYSDATTTQTFNTTADAEGTLRFEFEVPEDAPEGTARVELSGVLDGQPMTYVLDFEVTRAAAPTPTDGAIADTGAGVTNMMVLAAAVLVLGGGALAFAKSRTREDETIV